MERRLEELSRSFSHPVRHLLSLPERKAPGPTPLLVALHGQGMSAEGFLHRLRDLPLEHMPLLVPEGVFPFEQGRAAARRVGHAWYIYQGDQARFRDQMEATEAHLLRVLDEIESRLPVDRARSVLLGFSQGGYLAGFMGLRQRQRFGGLVIASARLKHEFLGGELEGDTLPKVLFVHSHQDEATPWDLAEKGSELLRDAGADVEVALHDDGHRLGATALGEIGGWLARKGFDAGPAG